MIKLMAPATNNCVNLQLRIDSPVTKECWDLWPQQTDAVRGGKVPSVFKELVTKVMVPPCQVRTVRFLVLKKDIAVALHLMVEDGANSRRIR